MDNITHTLVGAALGQAGLKRRTALGMATLVIGANLPDVDAITYWTGGAIGFRRGWTHGILALALLPLLLTGLVLAWDRLPRPRPRPALDSDRPAAVPREVLFLAFLAVLTHPVLDWLNSYGMRWLMPFRDAWYHGDAWFIMDPWVWLALGLGVALSAWLGRGGRGAGAADYPARAALALVAAYALAMLGISAAGRQTARQALVADGGAPAAVMVAPTFGDPLVWDVVAKQGEGYRFGTLQVVPWSVRLQATPLPSGLEDPAARAAAASPRARPFLNWARFPVFRVQRGASATLVRIADVRYGAQGWAAITVLLPPQPR
jgi:inner membrane protein